MPRSHAPNIHTHSRSIPVIAAALAAGVSVSLAFAGPLNPPPGAIAPSQKPLADIEPRTPISAATTPGGVGSVFRITEPGSYYLTTNLTGEPNKHGIEIAASNVTIDLAGFSVIGVPNSRVGVFADGVQNNLVIRNGLVTAWGFDGVSAGGISGTNCLVHDITSSANGGAGIRVPANSMVRDCIVQQNAGVGVISSSALTVFNVLARNNTGEGVFGGAGSTISHSAFRDNGARGVWVTSNSTVIACTAFSNDGDGIGAASGCLISDCTTGGNLGDGILVNNNCAILNNACAGNGAGTGDGAGIHLAGAGNRVEGNNCVDNDRGVDADSLGNIILRNTCRNNIVNWEVVAGNSCFVVTAVTGGAIIGNQGGASFAADPNANFTY